MNKQSPTKPQIHVFTGCGGVGKTTLSAAWALKFAQKQHRVALITIDPAKRLAQSLGLDSLSPTLQETNIHPNLWAMMLDQETTSHRLVNIYAKTPEHSQRILKNRYFKVFSSALAGVQEMMAIHEVHEAIHSCLYDVIILDTPPAQHTLDLLQVPQRLQRALDSKALAWVLKDSNETLKGSRKLRNKLSDIGKNFALKAFTKMTSSIFLEDLIDFLKLFHEVLNQIKVHGLSLEQTLKDNQTHFWLVTSPETAPLRAAQALSSDLESKGFSINGWFLNRMPTLYQNLKNKDDLDLLLASAKTYFDILGNDQHELIGKLLSTLHEEGERVLDAQTTLNDYQKNYPLTFLPSLSSRLAPVEIVRILAHQLEEKSI